MNPMNFGRISKRFAERKLSRRKALATGSAGIAGVALAATGFVPAATQEATPELAPSSDVTGEKTTYLFVQSFHSGSITPIEGQDGRYTVTLEHGTGQTIYFGDRPSRDVGVAKTSQFLEGLGFPEDNPPNAAMILETAPGETDVAVVELFNPTIQPDTGTVTYDVEVLENWEEDLELGLREDPADLAALAPTFAAAHLLIDDCPQGSISCYTKAGEWFFTMEFQDYCFDGYVCVPCEPYYDNQPEDPCEIYAYWDDWCNSDGFAQVYGCSGECYSSFKWLVSRACVR